MNDLYNNVKEYAAKENGTVQTSAFLRTMFDKIYHDLDTIEHFGPKGVTEEYAYAIDKVAEKVAHLLHALLYTSVKAWGFVEEKNRLNNNLNKE